MQVFENTEQLIKTRISDLKLPYFSCLVKQNGKKVYSFNYSIDKDNNNLLNMYSLSKPITTVAFFKLLEAKKINLDDKVSDYIDGFDHLHLLSNNIEVKKPMLIKHLLTMTSGLDYNLLRPSVIEVVNKKSKMATTIDVCSKFAKDGICFEPGERFQYSLSMDVIAAIVEIVSKQKFSSFVNENIFKPLGMSNSTFSHNQALSDKAIGEYNADNGTLTKADKYYKYFCVDSNYESGGAGLISTVEDYSLFADALANINTKIISNENIKTMSTLQVEDTPFNEGVSEYSKSSDEYGYGFGVRVRKVESKFGIPVGEFGWDSATGSYCLIDTTNKISIVIGLNIQGWPSYVKDLHIAIANSIYKDLKIK